MAELFTDFEVNRELRWPVVLRLLGGSFAAHLLVVITILYIPGVRDALNIAALIADTSFVDKPYEKTEIGDDVQLVELRSNRFRYPDGYFAPEYPAGMLPPPPTIAAPRVFAPVAPSVTSQAAPTPLALPSPSPIATPLPSPAA